MEFWLLQFWVVLMHFVPVAHEGRVFDVRRLELCRQGELPRPKGTLRAVGADRGNRGDRINCSLKVKSKELYTAL